MKLIFVLNIFLFLTGNLFSQERIPETILSNMTLKPSAQPYIASSFKVEKGVTLTILPGTKIIFKGVKTFTRPNDKKGSVSTFANILIEGRLIIGSTTGNNSLPIKIDANGLNVNFGFKAADVFINGLEATDITFNFTGNTTGVIKNSSFITLPTSSRGTVGIEVPIGKESITIQNCLFENQLLNIGGNNIFENMEKFKLSKCAFTFKSRSPELMDYKSAMTILIFGSQCDFYYDIDFTKLPLYKTESLTRDWYFGSEKQIKTDEIIKLHDNYIVNKSSKPFTTFKQEKIPSENGQNKQLNKVVEKESYVIPKQITSDLILKPGRPYESTGFNLHKEASLIILPGTKINFNVSTEDLQRKARFLDMHIFGSIVIGDQVDPNAKPVIFESKLSYLQIEIDGIFDINNFHTIGANITLNNNSNGSFKNCTFLMSPLGGFNYYINLSSHTSINFESCQFEFKFFNIHSSDSFNKTNLSLKNCSFSCKYVDQSDKNIKEFFIAEALFLYGTQCDFYGNKYAFYPRNYILSNPLSTDWYFGDDLQKNSKENFIKVYQNFTINISPKPFTTFQKK